MIKFNLYTLYPYIKPVKNKYGLLFSIIFGRTPNKIKLKNGSVIDTSSLQFETILCLLGTICFSTSYSVKSNIIELCFDTKNKFIINLNTLNLEDKNLLELLFFAQRHGANFLINEDIDTDDFRDKTFKISEMNGKKIIETSTGIKFYLDSMQPRNTIMETFVQKIHLISSEDDWNNKIVVDVGAECGDTPLYFASLGATVYAFEPVKAHYDAMMRNLSLNPELAKKIIPINAAIGKDELLKFNQSSLADIAGVASFVYNVYGKDTGYGATKTFEIQGYSLESAFEKFDIQHVDLLKMDCKGCEFFLTKEALKNVDKVKIEYFAADNSHKLKDLYNLLENAGFKNMIYRANPFANYSNSYEGRMYGKK
tara:strand:- start:771 stop:1874 length:1104 start_codon:yes stop_codon:yes gene_type:complete